MSHTTDQLIGDALRATSTDQLHARAKALRREATRLTAIAKRRSNARGKGPKPVIGGYKLMQSAPFVAPWVVAARHWPKHTPSRLGKAA